MNDGQREERLGSQRLDDVIAQYDAAVRAGQSPDHESWLARYPQYEEQLREYFERRHAAGRAERNTAHAGNSRTDATVEWAPESGGGPSREAPTSRPTKASGSELTRDGLSAESAHGPGATVGEFRLVRELGRGGMGVVYEAEQSDTGRRLAVKLLAPDLPHSDKAVERFLREASVAASLSHPRSTFIVGAGEDHGQFYIAMELMPGRTLRDLVETDGPMTPRRAVDALLDVVDGLEAAHRIGVVHRDVKPSNCFLDHDGRVKVGDFGLSKSLVSNADLTRTGTFMGTPQFAAPEQVRGGTVDQRTDIFALGATLYYLLAGRAPFQGDAAAVIAQIVADQAPSLRSICPDVPQALDKIVARTMDKDPARRFQSVADLREALLPFASGGTSIADLGRRLAAYFLDTTIVGFAIGLVTVISIMAYMMATGDSDFGNSWQFQVVNTLSVISGLVAYFAISEGLWGRSLGKRLLGLRVLDLLGQTPGYGRTLVRALMIPGLMWIPGLVAHVIVARYYSALWREEIWQSVIFPEAYVGMGWCVGLLCASTMRSKNGHRGLHELVSGTRVVRLRLATKTVPAATIPVIAPAEPDQATTSMGPYHVTGKLGARGEIAVLQGHDGALGRSVWLYVLPDERMRQSAPRIGISRPTRQFWLQAGRVNGKYWEAFEPVDGAPLADVARFERGLPWRQGRQVLLELAEELAAALADGTLPPVLTLDQVWVDRQGHVKLLDIPFRQLSADDEPTSPSPGFAEAGEKVPLVSTETNSDRALRLLQDASGLCAKDPTLPGHALEFVDDLADNRPDQETIAWAAKRLAEFSERPTRLNWDDRLGVLAVSWGLESTVFYFLSILIAMIVWTVPSLTMTARVSVILCACLPIPVIFGFLFRGGPAFRLCGVQVRGSKRQLATRLQCGWRSLLAWFPHVSAYGCLGLMIAAGFEAQSQAQRPTGIDERTFAALIAALALGWITLSLLNLVGAVVAVARPRRGLQDLAARTYLVPK